MLVSIKCCLQVIMFRPLLKSVIATWFVTHSHHIYNTLTTPTHTWACSDRHGMDSDSRRVTSIYAWHSTAILMGRLVIWLWFRLRSDYNMLKIKFVFGLLISQLTDSYITYDVLLFWKVCLHNIISPLNE